MKWILVVYLKKKEKEREGERKNAASMSDILQRNNFVEISPLWWLDCARHPAVRKPKGNKRFTHSWCVSQSLRLIITSSFLHSHPEVYISARRWCASKENGSYICSVSANPRGHFHRKYNNWLANFFVSWYTLKSIMRYTMFAMTFQVTLFAIVSWLSRDRACEWHRSMNSIRSFPSFDQNRGSRSNKKTRCDVSIVKLNQRCESSFIGTNIVRLWIWLLGSGTVCLLSQAHQSIFFISLSFFLVFFLGLRILVTDFLCILRRRTLCFVTKCKMEHTGNRFRRSRSCSGPCFVAFAIRFGCKRHDSSRGPWRLRYREERQSKKASWPSAKPRFALYSAMKNRCHGESRITRVKIDDSAKYKKTDSFHRTINHAFNLFRFKNQALHVYLYIIHVTIAKYRR